MVLGRARRSSLYTPLLVGPQANSSPKVGQAAGPSGFHRQPELEMKCQDMWFLQSDYSALRRDEKTLGQQSRLLPGADTGQMIPAAHA